MNKFLAWGVHIFTASGLVAGLLAIIAISEGNFRSAMLWMILALFIDGVDGSLARRFRVSEVLPNIQGKYIDYVVDFANYAIVPAYFVYASGLVPKSLAFPSAALILLVSAIYYGKDGMVSDDFYFIGFPVMWNTTGFFLYFVFEFPGWLNVAVIVALSIMHFLPIKFAYPSRATRFRFATISASVLLMIVMPVIAWTFPESSFVIRASAAAVLLYFAILAAIDTFTRD